MAGDDDELMFALYTDEDSDIGPGGWANSVLRWVIARRHSRPVKKVNICPGWFWFSATDVQLYWWSTQQHVCLIILATNFFSGNSPVFFFLSFLAYMELFSGTCLPAAFYMFYHRNAFVLWIRHIQFISAQLSKLTQYVQNVHVCRDFLYTAFLFLFVLPFVLFPLDFTAEPTTAINLLYMCVY